jgi:putative nucleotidyltransferase with HDIG domain
VTRAERALIVGQCGLLVASIVAGVLVSDAGDWQPLSLFLLLLAVAVVSEAFTLQAKGLSISAAFLAIALCTVLMGPAPAMTMGVLSVVASDMQRSSPWRSRLVNVSTYAFFPLLGGATFEALGGADLLHSNPPVYILLVFALFLVMNVVNFLLVATDFVVVEGGRIGGLVRTLYAPVLPVEFATGLLTAGVAYAYGDQNVAVIGLLAVVGLVFQYLLQTALKSLERKDELEGRTRELASLQIGLLGTVLQTLSLRDKMTARHSAAVARYSREIASELGLSEREQDVVHTAALLHDIGKFIFPDSILFASTRLSPEDLEIVRRHPEQGARLVARMDGYGPVAEIVLAHHERIDGGGYPNGLSGGEIPLAARIIAVADTYDVMTARDSYRRPVSSREAIAELRRVSGSQLDGDVVDTFIGLLEKRSVTFRHADDADFERELNLDRRIRDYAQPRVAAA